MKEEIWKDIPKYEGLYQASNKGKIKNIKRNKIKKQTINKDGYYVVKLSKNNKKKVFLVHRLIAETFLDYQKFKYTEKDFNNVFDKKDLVINHKDENKLNNNVNNLEWCTNLYNVNYSSKKTKKRNIKEDLYNYMIKNNINNDVINIIMNYF
jgi:hypothetical protein